MIKTEERNPNTTHVDRASTFEMVQIMQSANYEAVKAVDGAKEAVARAIDLIFPKMAEGGRLFYVGAGTSGRLGVLDASECPPTFGVSPDLVVGIIAGGDKALRTAVENAEDSAENGRKDLEAHRLCGLDSVVAISASGNAGYVMGALEYAKSLGCATVSLTSNPEAKMNAYADNVIFTDTGAEVITGSTRMKAGTAQKLVLNMLSTGLMIKLGMVYENLMINLKPTNIKLRDRMIRITSELSGMTYEGAEEALERSGWKIRDAISGMKYDAPHAGGNRKNE